MSLKNKGSVKWRLSVGYRKIAVLPDWYDKGDHAVLFDYDF